MAVGTTAFPTSLDTVVELVEVKNNASSTLSGNVLIGDVTIGVTDIAEFPTTGYGTLTDDLTTPTKTEIISWTGISGSNLTGCTRGTQGTSAAAFSSGNFIEVRPTAGHHEALRGAVIAIETKIGSGSAIAVNKLAALTASRLMVTDASGFASAASVTATEAGYLSGVTSAIQTQLNAKGAGDALVANPLSQFAATTSLQLLGVISDETGTGALVFGTSPVLTTPDINGGTADSLTSLSVRSTGAAFDLVFANTEVSTGNKTLTFKNNDANRTIDLGGNLTLAAAFSTSGANALTLTTTGATNVTLPTTGTLVNSAVTSLSSLTTVGTITSGGLSTGAVLGGVTMTLGSDADGDIYYRSSNVLTRLAKGTALQQLRMNAGATAPEWAAAAGGGLTIGTTAITSGTAGRILYETSGNVVGETAGFTYQPAASPNLTITAQAASYVGLRINSAATPSGNVFEVSADAGTTAHFAVSNTGAPSSPGAGAGSERYGLTSVAAGANSMAMGVGASSATANSMAIGRAATAGTATFTMAIGDAASATGSLAMAIGAQSSASGPSSIAIGVQAKNSGANAALITTANITYSGQNSYGFGVSTGHSQGATMSLGDGALPSGSNQFVAATGAGTANIGYQEVFFGRGVTHTSPQFWRLNGVGGSGTNIAGADINIAGGKGTGTGATGKVNLQTAPVGGSGSTLNALATALQVDADTTAGNTRFLIYDVDNATLERVSVGAADSGGTGFKLLRIAN